MPSVERRVSLPPDPPCAGPKLVPPPAPLGRIRRFGLSLITGAADDDPSAIGTYANAGAMYGPRFLWTAPALLPLMVAVVYLSSKLGMVLGQGIAGAIKSHYARWALFVIVGGVLAGNVVEAAADIGGVASAIHLFAPLPYLALIVPVALAIVAIQFFGSYRHLSDLFRWLALALLAYIGAAILAKPELIPVLKGTLLPSLQFNRRFFAMLVAVIGTSLSPYLYVWQASQEVEEEISMGRRRLSDRKGTTRQALHASAWDVIGGMFFSNLVMYFIILSTASTLFCTGQGPAASAAQVASALRPLAGNAAGVLFALGMIGVGFLAVPVMTVGAAYMLCESMGWKHSLHAAPSEARHFYLSIIGFTVLAAGIDFAGMNPIKMLVGAGIVQGFLAPVLLFLIMRMTASRKVMGEWVNTWPVNVLGWATTLLTAAAAGVLIWFSV